MGEAEVQILKGAALTVTDRCITTLTGEIPVTPALAPQLLEKEIVVPVRTTFLALAAMFFIFGLVAGMWLIFWLAAAILVGAAAVVKVKRRGFEVSVESEGARRPVYTTASEKDAQLALAALHEALRRAAA